MANFYQRAIRKPIEEVNLFKKEEDLWRTFGSVKNSSGILVLHIIGGMNHLIGAIHQARTKWMKPTMKNNMGG